MMPPVEVPASKSAPRIRFGTWPSSRLSRASVTSPRMPPPSNASIRYMKSARKLKSCGASVRETEASFGRKQVVDGDLKAGQDDRTGAFAGYEMSQQPVGAALKGEDRDSAARRLDCPVLRNPGLRVLREFGFDIVGFVARRDDFKRQIRRAAGSLAHTVRVLDQPA